MGEISAVVFDIGGVLLDWDPRYLYRRLFGADEAAMERFLAEVCTPQWHAAQDRGYPVGQACQELADRHPGQAGLIRAWAEGTEEMIAGPIEETVALLGELQRRGVPCYALSNMEAQTFPVRLARFGFLRALDGHVISGLEGLAKPDLRIFELLLSRFGLDPGATLFIDDNAANVAAARTAGLQAIRFVSPGSLRAELAARGLVAAGPGPLSPG